MVAVKESLSHNSGKRETNPKINIMPPENHFQKSCGISISNVLALSSSVKRIIESASEVTTTKSLLLLKVESVRDLPTITGNKGSMHGASTVNTPATNEMMRSVMLFYFRH